MDINEIIDNLCNKLGTTAELLIPEYAKMKIASSVVEIIISAVIIAALVFIAKKVYKWMRDNEIDKYDDAFFWIVLCGVCGVGGAAVCAINIMVNVIGISKFVTSPVAAFIEEMLKGLK